ncbi:MAG: TetR/AcrR family transcriptional regulator [Ichthyobacteriaceae bacterium]|nr:TetR/AcrR family transcriptional regulator [Ichthyobacteriaceae bacterium]
MQENNKIDNLKYKAASNKALSRDELIIESALKLFSKLGFENTSMQLVAKEAGVSKGNLYNYFNSKDHLLESLLAHWAKKNIELYSSGLNYGLKSVDDFENLVRYNFKLIKSDKYFWKLYYNLAGQPSVNKIFMKVFYPFKMKYILGFSNYYKHKGIENYNAKATLLVSAIDGVALSYIMMINNEYPLNEVLNELIKQYK